MDSQSDSLEVPVSVNAHPPLQGIGEGGGYTQPTISYPH